MKAEESDIEPAYDFDQAKQGAIVRPPANKTRITIRLNTDILDWFREQVNRQGGGSYQALINQALSQHIQSQNDEWETTLRRILREELQSVQQVPVK